MWTAAMETTNDSRTTHFFHVGAAACHVNHFVLPEMNTRSDWWKTVAGELDFLHQRWAKVGDGVVAEKWRIQRRK
jgi:hypothetical protein